MPAVGSTSSQEDFSVDIDIPDNVTTGEAVSISVPATTPDLPSDHEAELSVTLYVDGEKEAARTLSIRDGETTEASFGYTFKTEGTHTVEVEAGITLGGQTFSSSTSTSIEVTPPSTDTTPTSTVSGAAFSTPESLTDEVETYREQAATNLAPQAFVLATENQLYLVFTDKQPRTGIATVEGISPSQEVTSQGLSFNILVASNTSFDTIGTRATVLEITSSPEYYQHELVRISATHRRVSSLTDPDQGNNFTAASSFGLLIENPQTPKRVLSQLGPRTRSLTINASTDEHDPNTSTGVSGLLDTNQPKLHTIGLERAFWRNTHASVTGIVLTPESAAQEFISEFDRNRTARDNTDAPLLFVTESTVAGQQYESVTSLKNQASPGDEVSVTANVYAQQLSAQETVEHSTSCGRDRTQVPTPSGPICIDVTQDVHIHSGVTWTGEAQSKSDLLFTAGLSSRHLDQPMEPVTGRYRIVGKLVSTDQVAASLPEGQILVISDLERVGSIQTPLQDAPKAATEQMTSQLREQVVAPQSETQKDSGQTGTQEDSGTSETEDSETANTIRSIVPGETVEASLAQSNTALQKIEFNSNSRIDNTTIRVSQVSSPSQTLPLQLSDTTRYLNISVSRVSDSDIDTATLHLALDESEVRNVSNLVVYRFHQGSWQALETEAERQGGKIVLEAQTPGFSYFAIGTSQSTQAGSDQSSVDITLPSWIQSNAGLLLVIPALLSLAVLQRRFDGSSPLTQIRTGLYRVTIVGGILERLLYLSFIILIGGFLLFPLVTLLTIPQSIVFIWLISIFLTVTLLVVMTGQNVVRYLYRKVLDSSAKEATSQVVGFSCESCGETWTYSLSKQDLLVEREPGVEISLYDGGKGRVPCPACSNKQKVLVEERNL